MKKRTQERIRRMSKRYGYELDDFVGLLIESFNRQDRILKEIFQIDGRDNEIIRKMITSKRKVRVKK